MPLPKWLGRLFRRRELPRTTSDIHEEDAREAVLRAAMATEMSEKLMRRWDRLWFGSPKHERENADLMERYEWMYGRSMGNRDELLQRLQVHSGMVPVLEYTADMAGSASTGLLSNPGAQTPDASSTHGRDRRTSLLLETSTGDLNALLMPFKRNESSNSWQFRIFPRADSPPGSLGSASPSTRPSMDQEALGARTSNDATVDTSSTAQPGAEQRPADVPRALPAAGAAAERSRRLPRDTAATRSAVRPTEESLSRDAWNWRFTRKWVSERNRAGVDVDEEGRAFQALLAGEMAPELALTPRRSTGPQGPGPSATGGISKGGTMSESLMFQDRSTNGGGDRSSNGGGDMPSNGGAGRRRSSVFGDFIAVR